MEIILWMELVENEDDENNGRSFSIGPALKRCRNNHSKNSRRHVVIKRGFPTTTQSSWSFGAIGGAIISFRVSSEGLFVAIIDLFMTELYSDLLEWSEIYIVLYVLFAIIANQVRQGLRVWTCDDVMS